MEMCRLMVTVCVRNVVGFTSTLMDHEEKNTSSNTTVAEARHATEFLKSNSVA